jgi:hypothetical protein
MGKKKIEKIHSFFPKRPAKKPFFFGSGAFCGSGLEPLARLLSAMSRRGLLSSSSALDLIGIFLGSEEPYFGNNGIFPHPPQKTLLNTKLY